MAAIPTTRRGAVVAAAAACYLGGRHAWAATHRCLAIETAHFEFHYPEPLGDVARNVALCG